MFPYSVFCSTVYPVDYMFDMFILVVNVVVTCF